MKEAILRNWKTTLVGTCQLVNNIVPCVETFRAAMTGVYDQHRIAITFAVFLLINGILQQIKAALMKDAGKGSDRPQEVVDQKLDHVLPKDAGI